MEKGRMTADVVVIGTGGAGMVAAIQATLAGAKVIALEKNVRVGGNCYQSEGVLGIDTEIQAAAGVKVDKMDLFRKELEFHNYNVDPLMWKTVMDHAKENFEWLVDLGVKFDRVGTPGVGGELTWHVFQGLGQGYFDNTLVPKAKELGIEILLETPATGLIMDHGRVAGVKAATKDGQELIINGKAVIIATGGFHNSPEMVKELTNENLDRLINAGEAPATGDGIKMARAVGATSRGWAILSKTGGLMEGFTVIQHIMVPGCMEPTSLWVNQSGLRFVDEGVVFQYVYSGNAITSQQKVFSVIDSAMIERLVNDGCINGAGAFTPAGTKLTELKRELKEALDNKAVSVFKGDTLEELAGKIGVDKDTFLKSGNDYNAICARGTDTDFGKDPRFLIPIQKAPFYAFRVKGCVLNSMGGIQANSKCEVLNEDLKAIPGLYAAGMELDGFTGDTYGMTIPGSTNGIALHSGRTSALNAVRHMQTVK